ncbi:MAG: hypothetical protein SFZ24_04835 [Planctomycetota bacterium]|nr:hypothetical protein [Planctomycetota bacterium]
MQALRIISDELAASSSAQDVAERLQRLGYDAGVSADGTVRAITARSEVMQQGHRSILIEIRTRTDPFRVFHFNITEAITGIKMLLMRSGMCSDSAKEINSLR